MEEYKVVVVPEVKAKLQSYLHYLRNVKQNPQAYQAVRDDYKETVIELAKVAGSRMLCENPMLRAKLLRKMQFKHHDYVLLYRIEDGNIARVIDMYHMSEDYENRIV